MDVFQTGVRGKILSIYLCAEVHNRVNKYSLRNGRAYILSRINKLIDSLSLCSEIEHTVSGNT